ncbi:MAG: drug resistance transporter, EmrB/QacA subfamily [Chloroflexi bacterium]|nr:drug resistance transporter, EmrB/QacA subfamily [Chloroflexota bacterium]
MNTTLTGKSPDISEPEKNSVWLVVAALMLTTFLAALDGSIVSTAMPTITGQLGGFNLYSWVFSIYLLTSTVTVPIYGKLADLYGRKRVLLVGTGLFLVGSALCGYSQSMLELVIFRGIQGIGGGAILPIASTILGDLFPPAQRAKIQGWTGSVWGISAVAGPALGGFIVDHTTWRWIFFLNLPIGILALLAIVFFFHERMVTRNHKIDIAGAVTLMLGTSALLIGLTLGGRDWPWLSLESILTFTVAVVSLAAFFLVERVAGEPLLPLSLFQNRLIRISGIAALLMGGVLIGIVTYVPLFVQGVLGTSATIAGGVLATMSIGWPLAGSFAGRTIMRWGYRQTALLGGSILLLSVLMMLVIDKQTSPIYIALCALVSGFGLGFSTTSFIVGIQNEVNWERRGVATASNLFLRSLGSTIWVAGLGSILTNTLVSQTAPVTGPNQNPLDLVNTILNPASGQKLEPGVQAAVQSGLEQAFRWVTIVEVLTAIVALLVIWRMPRSRVIKDSVTPPASSPGVPEG